MDAVQKCLQILYPLIKNLFQIIISYLAKISIDRIGFVGWPSYVQNARIAVPGSAGYS